MKNSDKILIAIVVGVVLLVAVAFVVALTRPDPTYKADDTPEGVAHNYLLAFQKRDYERAYRYLSPELPHYPADLNEFMTEVQNERYNFHLDQNPVTLEIVSSQINGDLATVDVRQTTFYEGDLFNSGESSYTFSVRLSRNSAGVPWRIIGSDRYWVYCWGDTSSPSYCD